MNLNGNILVIEDDIDDQEFIQDIFEEVIAENGYSNKIVILPDSSKVIEYMKGLTEKPFLMISDVNMPKVDGFQLREEIFNNPEINQLSVPYIFLTTSGNNADYIKRAYGLSIQGYFAKPNDYGELKKLAYNIISYWKSAKVPRSSSISA